MLRVTVELVPFGVEEMSKTLAELCIANVFTKNNTADYEVAGYRLSPDNKRIEEFAIELKSFARDAGVLALLREVLSTEISEFDKVELAEQLIQRTRLYAEGEKDEA